MPLLVFGNLSADDSIIIVLVMLLLFSARRWPDLREGLRTLVRAEPSGGAFPLDVFLFVLFLIIFTLTITLHHSS